MLMLPLLGVLLLASANSLPVVSSGQSEATYIGSDACASCHQLNHNEWSQSLHSRMIQPAGPKSILGDFSQDNTLEHQGWRFKMVRDGDSYVINEWDDAGRKTVYPVDYTLGSKRIQHFLSKRPDGRIRVTLPTWDTLQQRWFHSSEIIPTGDHAEVPIQIWNQHCYNCHVSQEQQGFDLRSNTYRTSFTQTGINCEMCHGPGSVHAANPLDKDSSIVHPGKLPPDQKMMVCVQCHFPRVIVQHGYHPGKNYYDYYLPTLMQFFVDRQYDPPMWADGRMRRFATEGAALWQSQCYLKGQATCISCHNPHLNTVSRDERLQGDTNGLCIQCHEAFAEPEQVTAHTHHSLDSGGSQCVECHMPKEVLMLTDRERDHTISIPAPENTLRHQIPNACTSTCHTDKAAQWAIAQMDRWYPNRAKANLLRANAFTLARDRDPTAIDALIGLLRDKEQNRVIRGSAAGFLGEFQGEKVAEALVDVLDDSDVLIRAEAARSLSEVRQSSAAQPLAKLLRDPNRIVRLNAIFALIKMGRLKLEGAYRQDFERVRLEFEQFLHDFPDVYSVRVNLGTYHAIQRQYLVALQEYRNAIKVQPQLPLAHYYEGVTLAQLGLYREALSSFAATLQREAGFRNTETLVKQVEAVLDRSQNQ